MGHLRGMERLVAKGFTQTYGIDYQETFAPIAKMNSICALLPSTPNVGCPLQQFSNDDGPIEVLIINKSSITFG